MSRWDNLSMKDKSDLMRLYIKSGIKDIDLIKEDYNKFDTGGPKDLPLNKYKEVTIKKEPWADVYFRNNPNVDGMAIGEGLNGVDGERRVIINPYSKGINKESVLLNERLRHYMEESDFRLPYVTQEQMDKYEGTAYQGDTLNVGRTEAARYLSGDKSLLDDNIKEYIDTTLFKVNKFEDGGSASNQRADLIGKVPFNPFKLFNWKNLGTNIYDAPSFSDAFRQARIDGQEKFIYKDKVYNTELAPNKFVEAARNWDTEGDPAKEDFRMQIIRTPNEVFDYYNKTYSKKKGYVTGNKRVQEYDIPYMYSLGTAGVKDLVIKKGTNYNIGDAIWEELDNHNLSYNQKLAILANSYHETDGWTALKQYRKGPASGVFMMEKPQKDEYEKWRKKNNLEDNYSNQTRYVVSLFTDNNPSLVTAWDRAGNKQEEIRKYKDSEEARSEGYRSAYNHMDYTTKQAFEDWESDNLDNTVKAFEGLFERAGLPAIENRQRIANILSKKYLD